MDWLMEMNPRVSGNERIPSEEGKQVGSVPWASSLLDHEEMTLVKEKFPNRFAQPWSHQAGEKQPNTTKAGRDKSRELKLIIKTNKLFVSFSIWHHGFELLRWKLYLGDSRAFMAMLNQSSGFRVRSWQSDVGMCCSDTLRPPGCSQEKPSLRELHQKITFGRTRRAGRWDFLIPF